MSATRSLPTVAGLRSVGEDLNRGLGEADKSLDILLNDVDLLVDDRGQVSLETIGLLHQVATMLRVDLGQLTKWADELDGHIRTLTLTAYTKGGHDG